jgi:hypothetical protein
MAKTYVTPILDLDNLKRSKEDELLWNEAYNKGKSECAEEKIREFSQTLKQVFNQFSMWEKSHIICIINDLAKKAIKKENGSKNL